MLAGDLERERRSQQLVMAGAWTCASLSRKKRMPSLKKVLGSKAKELTAEELAQAKADHEAALRLSQGAADD